MCCSSLDHKTELKWRCGEANFGFGLVVFFFVFLFFCYFRYFFVEN